MIEYNYFNNDFTNKVTKMDTNNKDYIYWYNMRFSQLKNTKGNPSEIAVIEILKLLKV